MPIGHAVVLQNVAALKIKTTDKNGERKSGNKQEKQSDKASEGRRERLQYLQGT